MLPLATAVLRLGTAAPERALELECRDGDGALFLAREFPGARVRGVDSRAERVAGAGRRVGLDPEGRIAFKRGTPRDLPFPDDHFDLVVQVRGPLAPPEAARVLRPGGRLLLVGLDPDRDLLGLRRRLRRARLARAGFEPVEVGEAGGRSFAVMAMREGLAGHRSD